MAGGSGGRNLEETPTWAVATVCFVLILISIIIEHIIHLIGKWFKKKHKRALYESLEKIKSVVGRSHQIEKLKDKIQYQGYVYLKKLQGHGTPAVRRRKMNTNQLAGDYWRRSLVPKAGEISDEFWREEEATTNVP
ncbi:Mlo-related protein, partial [Sesbania bispinosa]